MEYSEINVNSAMVTVTTTKIEKTPKMIIEEAEVVWRKEGKESCYDYLEKQLDTKEREDIPSYLFLLSRTCHDYVINSIFKICFFASLLWVDFLFIFYHFIANYDKLINSYMLYIHGSFSLVIIVFLGIHFYLSYILNKILDVLLEY